jgi:hypothetical protein
VTAESGAAVVPIVEFRGRVECRLAAAPLGLRLSGRTAGRGGEMTHVDFRGPPPVEWPASLYDVKVEPGAPGTYRVVGAAQVLVVHAAGVHVHREIEAAFRAVVPQREAPLSKRLFWRIVLALAASDRGRQLLLALRGRG